MDNGSPKRRQVRKLLFAAHEKLVTIHPFTDGNGRTAPPLSGGGSCRRSGTRDGVYGTKEAACGCDRAASGASGIRLCARLPGKRSVTFSRSVGHALIVMLDQALGAPLSDIKAMMCAASPPAWACNLATGRDAAKPDERHRRRCREVVEGIDGADFPHDWDISGAA